MPNEKRIPGTPLTHRDQCNDRTGFVVSVDAPECETWTIGAQGMVQNELEYTVVWTRRDDAGFRRGKSVSTIHDGVCERFFKNAEDMSVDSIDSVELERLVQEAEAYQADSLRKANAQREARDAEVAAFQVVAAEKMPLWAEAVIIAEHRVDQSDIYTDYFAHTTDKCLILGFSKHCRDLFPEMRKAALNSPLTEHLFDAEKTAEHREKWSMGGGYYLKNGGRHSDGWAVKKVKLYNGAQSIPVGEWCLTKPKRDTVAPANTGESGKIACHLEEHEHTKKRFTMHMVILDERVERDDFVTLRSACKAAGGWYSRKWSTTPGGFAFEDRADAEAFAGSL